MNSYPDFSPQGYQVISELGRNREGGRITWLVSDLNTGQQVVLKQFCFAQVGSSWSAFRAHEREIQVLKGLNHPGIPRYLGAFETQDGFCLIQEYKNAPSLAVQRSFEPEEINQIAVKVLEILVYLQNRIPPVIHRDIKPENILVDDQLNVYLIDFGMSRLGSQEVSGSSVFQGTPGFIPPEQMRKPTEASDLYGLGAMLICLLTGTKSTAIQDLTDEDDPYLINFRHLLPQLSLRFLDWLEKMVQPSLKKRFANAQTALEALIPLDVIRVLGEVICLPRVELSQSALEFQATHLGEKLTQTVTVENSIPDTVLEGKWEVAPYAQDPPHTPDAHAWISVEPAKFARNHSVCHIHVDTSKLMADKLYERQLLLQTNAYPEIYPLAVRVQTAPLPIERRKVPYAELANVLLICAIA
ncbi:MAG: serine/threonine protein kinase [Scytonema sp. CRU_2_7]|nr:serine/threonine protein kinase [Scytonema sp. CRU_2_7]